MIRSLATLTRQQESGGQAEAESTPPPVSRPPELAAALGSEPTPLLDGPPTKRARRVSVQA